MTVAMTGCHLFAARPPETLLTHTCVHILQRHRVCARRVLIATLATGNSDGKPPPVQPTTRTGGGGDGDNWRRVVLYPLFALVMLCIAANEAERRRFEKWCESDADQDPRTVSIIVPTLNEELVLPELIALLKSLQPLPFEIIFADGGSTDSTVKIASRAGIKVVRSKKGRGRQMNAGAQAAKGDYLCFVHADSRPCADIVNVIKYELRNPGRVGGGFVTRIAYKGRLLWWMTTHHFLKTYYMPMLLRPYAYCNGFRSQLGDQNIFVRSKDFHRVGGYDGKLAIMEDADLVLRLHEEGTAEAPGKRAAVRHVMYRGNETSGRRMLAWGPLYSTYLHFKIGLMWHFGCSYEQLQQVYDTRYGDDIRSV